MNGKKDGCDCNNPSVASATVESVVVRTTSEISETSVIDGNLKLCQLVSIFFLSFFRSPQSRYQELKSKRLLPSAKLRLLFSDIYMYILSSADKTTRKKEVQKAIDLYIQCSPGIVLRRFF